MEISYLQSGPNKWNISASVKFSDLAIKIWEEYDKASVKEENNSYIVEIKGYKLNNVYKVDLLRDEYNLKIILIDDIKPYITNNSSYHKELLEWKDYIKNEKFKN